MTAKKSQQSFIVYLFVWPFCTNNFNRLNPFLDSKGVKSNRKKVGCKVLRHETSTPVLVKPPKLDSTEKVWVGTSPIIGSFVSGSTRSGVMGLGVDIFPYPTVPFTKTLLFSGTRYQLSQPVGVNLRPEGTEEAMTGWKDYGERWRRGMGSRSNREPEKKKKPRV